MLTELWDVILQFLSNTFHAKVYSFFQVLKLCNRIENLQYINVVWIHSASNLGKSIRKWEFSRRCGSILFRFHFLPIVVVISLSTASEATIDVALNCVRSRTWSMVLFTPRLLLKESFVYNSSICNIFRIKLNQGFTKRWCK